MAQAEPLPLSALLLEEWDARAIALGGRKFHGRQIFRWIHQRGIFDPAKMTDLPGALREKLTEAGLAPPSEITEMHRSTDDTRKILTRFVDGAVVETVLIPGVTGPQKFGASGGRSEPTSFDGLEDADASASDLEGDDDDDDVPSGPAHGRSPSKADMRRVTQCISTQVGCAMGCVFCASGVAGLKRHLGAHEIAAQVYAGRANLDPNERLRNLVYMGMGEPLHNYEATARSLRLLTSPDGLNLSPRRITVSTSGLVPEIARLGEEFGGHIGLAISLHAVDDDARTRLMPINKKYPLKELLAALAKYPLPKRRRITIEYTLVAGKNDTLEEAAKLASILRNLPVKVNLIPMNPIEASTLGPPDFARVNAFQEVVASRGLSVFVRKRRGDDVAAACGQLALAGAKPKVRVNRS